MLWYIFEVGGVGLKGYLQAVADVEAFFLDELVALWEQLQKAQQCARLHTIKDMLRFLEDM